MTEPARPTLLDRAFFARPVLDVARELLGCELAHAGVTVRITETEAYSGGRDPASRVLSRQTRHNAPVFGAAGHLFVYFTYGHHWMPCVVTGRLGEPDDVASAVAELRARGVRFADDGAVEDTPVCHMAFGRDSEGNGFILHKRK